MENTFVKYRTLTDYIISLSVFLLGLVLIMLSSTAAMNIAGAMIVILGVVLFFSLRSAWKEVVTGDTYHGKVLYYNRSKKQAILDALTSDFSKISEIDQEENAQKSLRLDVYYNEAKGKYYCRLYEYIPYEYVPQTELLVLQMGGRKTSPLSSQVNRTIR